jgi:transketolase
MSAAHYALDNLVVIVDRNGLQITGPTEQIHSLEPLDDKLRAFGYTVRTVDGNDVSALRTAFGHVPFEKGRPNLVVARTTKGKGISFVENVPGWHHRVPSEDELAEAMSELDAAEENLKRES